MKINSILFLFCVMLLALSCSKDQAPLEIVSLKPPPPPPPPVDPLSGTSWVNEYGSSFNGPVYTLEPRGTDLFVGGAFTYYGNFYSLFLFSIDANYFNSYPQSGIIGSRINSLITYNGWLMGAGAFSDGSGMANCGTWNGTMLAGSIYSMGGVINTAMVHNNEVYVGGGFTVYNSIFYNYVAKHDGVSYLPMGSGFNNPVRALAVYNNEVYACGDFTMSGSTFVNHIAKWNGTSWDPIGTGLNGNAYCLAVYNNELYVGGVFTQAGSTSRPYIARWNGSYWDGAGIGMSGCVYGVKSLSVINNYLIAGGDFSQAGTILTNSIAKWDGTNWYSMGAYLSSNTYMVNDICLFNNKLYIACGLGPSQGWLLTLSP